ncbi:zwei Ig domain protein zig-2 isoform X2 [Octopus bimaculoides]|uniref:Ig-like domain-containing protein n=1 Tax=Octopus bimaculoides TaxID=37653 RepID=A0A0L8I9N4_OCTBM|nr:zwei Ig domain protein zig-2 isoform X2 [Octopus bimaculoides]|eukprot:XP_014786701.1 PREDICTED: neural/ectodermal development factor IMP-L2-like isoform X2 [Octopus bimaculoides]
MKTTSIVVLILYYWLGCCYSYRDIYKKQRSPFRRNWYQQNRVGSKRVRSPLAGKLHFSSTPEEQKIVSIGESFTLSCDIISKPHANMYWNKNGVRIPQGASSNLVDEQRYEDKVSAHRRPRVRQSSQMLQLFIDCFTPEKAGTYECVAETDSHRISHSTVVETGRFPAKEQCNSNGMGARIYSYTTYRIEKSGTAVQLSCRAQGTPTPTISWYKDKKKILPSTSGYKLLANGDLVLESWHLNEHFFLFTCKAENDFGNDSISSSVYLVSNKK